MRVFASFLILPLFMRCFFAAPYAGVCFVFDAVRPMHHASRCMTGDGSYVNRCAYQKHPTVHRG